MQRYSNSISTQSQLFSPLHMYPWHLFWKHPLGLAKWSVELLPCIFILLILTALRCFSTSRLLCRVLYLDCFNIVYALNNAQYLWMWLKYIPTNLVLYPARSIVGLEAALALSYLYGAAGGKTSLHFQTMANFIFPPTSELVTVLRKVQHLFRLHSISSYGTCSILFYRLNQQVLTHEEQ